MANWSDHDDAKLRKWFLEGLSASQMSARLANDRSRNAVIGRLNRLGLKRGGNSRRDNKPTPHRRVPPRVARQPVLRPVHAPEPFVPENRIVRPANAKRITVENLEKHHCRFVHGDPVSDQDWTFCGEPVVPGQAWCSVHHHVAYPPRPPRPPRPDERRVFDNQINAEISRLKKEFENV